MFVLLPEPRGQCYQRSVRGNGTPRATRLRPRTRARRAAWIAGALVCACSRAAPQEDAGAAPASALPAESSAVGSASPASATAAAPQIADAGQDAAEDPRPLHLLTQEDLLALVELLPPSGKRRDPMPFLKKAIGPGGPARGNQGNPDLARHE